MKIKWDETAGWLAARKFREKYKTAQHSLSVGYPAKKRNLTLCKGKVKRIFLFAYINKTFHFY